MVAPHMNNYNVMAVTWYTNEARRVLLEEHVMIVILSYSSSRISSTTPAVCMKCGPTSTVAPNANKGMIYA
eukprot:6299674-Amphidinium_carterae.1